MRRMFGLAIGALGVVTVLLGSLWFLQGADVVRIAPILCVADCETISGGSVGWMIAGAVAFLGGLLAIGLSMRLVRR